MLLPHHQRPGDCVLALLAEQACVEPVLLRVVQVFVEVHHRMLHACRWKGGRRARPEKKRAADEVQEHAPRPRHCSSSSSDAVGSASVGVGALLGMDTSRRFSSVGCILAPSICAGGCR